jgi:hypothetical protein
MVLQRSWTSRGTDDPEANYVFRSQAGGAIDADNIDRAWMATSRQSVWQLARSTPLAILTLAYRGCYQTRWLGSIGLFRPQQRHRPVVPCVVDQLSAPFDPAVTVLARQVNITLAFDDVGDVAHLSTKEHGAGASRLHARAEQMDRYGST